jgi:hypothetical protein
VMYPLCCVVNIFICEFYCPLIMQAILEQL